MAAETRETTLVLSAKDLASSVVGKFGSGLDTVVSKAEGAARKIGQGFENATNAVSNAFGNLTENLLSGQDLGSSFLTFGIYLGGQMAEGLIGQLLEKLAGSTLVQAVGGAMAAAGSTIGGLISAAIPIGMALLPVLLVGAIVAAVIFLINNPEIVDKILEFAGGVVDFIIKGLVALPGMLLDFFGDAWQGVVDAVGPFVQSIVDWFLGIPGDLANLGASIVNTIVGGLVSLPGKIWDVVTDAFSHLRIDIGPFHIRSTGVTIDMPTINAGPGQSEFYHSGIGGHAKGGWAGLNGPELSWLGEGGEPELVIPRSQLAPGMGGGVPAHSHPIYVDGRQLAELMDEAQGTFLRRAAITEGRV